MVSRIIKSWNKKKMDDFLRGSEAILFDLDGTLFDLNVNWREIKNHFSSYTKEKFNVCLPSNRFYENFKFIEDSYGKDELDYYSNYLKEQELIAVRQTLPSIRWLMDKGVDIIKKKVPKI